MAVTVGEIRRVIEGLDDSAEVIVFIESEGWVDESCDACLGEVDSFPSGGLVLTIQLSEPEDD